MKRVLWFVFSKIRFSYADTLVVVLASHMGGWQAFAFVIVGLQFTITIGHLARRP